jgi:hypothetical protein
VHKSSGPVRQLQQGDQAYNVRQLQQGGQESTHSMAALLEYVGNGHGAVLQCSPRTDGRVMVEYLGMA